MAAPQDGDGGHWIRVCRDGQGHEWEYTPESDATRSWAKFCVKCSIYKGANHPDPDLAADGAGESGD